MTFDLKKSKEENKNDTKWVVKVDQMLRDTLRKEKLISFGTHFNIHFSNWEGLSETELFESLSKVCFLVTERWLH